MANSKDNCEFCGKSFINAINRYRTTIHHIDGNFFNNDPENRMVVHKICHKRVHDVEKMIDSETDEILADLFA